MTPRTAGVSALLGHDPARIGPYELVGRLGAGGMGVVYAGLAATDGRVAVKVVHPELAHDPDFRDRFAREIALLEKVHSVCTVKVLGSEPEAAQPWFATEYVPGPTLDAYVRTNGPLAGDELYGVASGLAEALVSMHAVGVVHRDLKPANVILSPSGPRVVDLGIARAMNESSVTRTGVLLGSPAWLSPEHYRDDEVGPASDVHAWGLLMAFAATGRLPFGSGRPEVLAVRILQNDVDLTGLEPELREVVGKALAKDPGERPTARELLTLVTETWRRTTDATTDDLPDADTATAMIERTWVMPDAEDPTWVSTAPGTVSSQKGTRRLPKPALVVVGAVTVVGVMAATVLSTGLYPGHGAASAKRQGSTRGSRPPAANSASRIPNPSAESVTSRSESASGEPPLQGSRVVIDAQISAIVPTGWTAQTGTDTVGPYVCMLMPGAQDHCMRNGILIESWTGSGISDQPDLSDTQSWVGDTDPSALSPPCFHPNSSEIVGITSATVDSPSLRKLGNRSAIFRQYHIACGSTYAFNPRIWWLPKTRLMMTVVALPERYRQTVDQIAASFHFS